MATEQSTDWAKVSLIILAGVLAAFQVGKLPVSLLALRDDLGLGLVFVGWIVSLLHTIGLVFGMTAGTVADRLGHRRAMLLGLLCIAASSALGAVSQSGDVILVSRVGEGIGVILILVAAPTLIVRFSRPDDRGLVLGIWGIWMPVGSGLMILISPLILEPYGWRGVWILNAVLLLAYAAIFASATRGLRQPADGVSGKTAPTSLWDGARRTATSKGPLVLTAASAVAAASTLSVSAFLPTFLVEDGAADLSQAAVLTGIVVLVGAVGNVASGWLLSRGARLWAVIATSSVVLGLVGVWIFAIDLPVAARYLLCGIYFISVATVFSALWSGVPMVAVSPDLIATTHGFRLQGVSLGMILGPPAVAGLATGTSWQDVSWLVAGLAVTGVLLAFQIRPLENASRGSTAPPG